MFWSDFSHFMFHHLPLISHGIAFNLQKLLFNYSLDGLVIILVQFSPHQTKQDLYSHEAISGRALISSDLHLIFYPVVMNILKIIVMICASKFISIYKKWHNSNWWATPIFLGACAGDARLSCAFRAAFQSKIREESGGWLATTCSWAPGNEV